jgi:YidC/Oxa1 family membrane protein insertase
MNVNIFQLILIQPLTNGLILFYKVLWENMGLAIIGFSIFLRFVLNPLTKPYMNSMKKMKEVEPLIAKLKKKYQNDPKGLMAAQAELYRQKNIKPGSGCLPYLLQIVVLIALYNVFTQVLSTNTDVISKVNQLLYPALKFSGNQAINSSFLYLDIRKPDVFHLPGISFPIPGPIIILAGLLQFLSAKMNMPLAKKEEKAAKTTKSDTDDMATAMQSSMIYTFPLMTILFGVKFPSGLALYWLMFSIFQIWQQYVSTGWGGLTPWIKRIGLIKSAN